MNDVNINIAKHHINAVSIACSNECCKHLMLSSSQEGIISGNAALNDANIASISQEGIISYPWKGCYASLVLLMLNENMIHS